MNPGGSESHGLTSSAGPGTRRDAGCNTVGNRLSRRQCPSDESNFPLPGLGPLQLPSFGSSRNAEDITRVQEQNLGCYRDDEVFLRGIRSDAPGRSLVRPRADGLLLLGS